MQGPVLEPGLAARDDGSWADGIGHFLAVDATAHRHARYHAQSPVISTSANGCFLGLLQTNTLEHAQGICFIQRGRASPQPQPCRRNTGHRALMRQLCMMRHLGGRSDLGATRTSCAVLPAILTYNSCWCVKMAWHHGSQHLLHDFHRKNTYVGLESYTLCTRPIPRRPVPPTIPTPQLGQERLSLSTSDCRRFLWAVPVLGHPIPGDLQSGRQQARAAEQGPGRADGKTRLHPHAVWSNMGPGTRIRLRRGYPSRIGCCGREAPAVADPWVFADG